MLRVYIDFKSPAAYLALGPTLALIDKFKLEVEWRPIKTTQQSVPPAQPTDQKPEIHRRVRAVARRNTYLLYAGVLGVEMYFRDLPGETDLALAALSSIEGSPIAYMQNAFRAYWVDGADLNDPQIVGAALQVSGCDAPQPDHLDTEVILTQAAEAALADGVVDAPGYVIDGQVFIGREHLPWIESLLN